MERYQSVLGTDTQQAARMLAPGVHYIRSSLTRQTSKPAQWRLEGPALGNPSARDWFSSCLGQITMEKPRFEFFQLPPDLEYQVPLLGDFASKKEAGAALRSIGGKACGLSVRHASYSPRTPNDNLTVHAVFIEPDHFKGRMEARLAKGTVAGRESVLTLAARTRHIAAINASFFVMTHDEGVPGDVSGLFVTKGHLLSEPTMNRPVMIWDSSTREHPFKITTVEPDIWIRFDDGSRIRVHGVNRRPGLVRNCGLDADGATQLPVHDETCESRNEVIVLDRFSGFPAEFPDAYCVVVDGDAHSVPCDSAVTPTASGFLLVATGSQKSELRERLRKARPLGLSFDSRLRGPGIFAISGAPSLVRDGLPIRHEHLEGWPEPDSADLRRWTKTHRWLNARNPRTAAGVYADGTLVLLVVDGRQPGVSTGFTISELRQLMLRMGVADALNLDGGGSSTLVIDGELANSPSDADGARAVADALIIIGDSTHQAIAPIKSIQ